jgi:hypothetical protein
MSGSFNLSGATTALGGVVYNNLSTGIIEKVILESKLETTFTLDQMAMVAHSNAGTIRDIHIESSTRWRFPTTNFNWAIVALTNTGTIQRVVNKGQMFNEDYSIESIASLTGKAVKTGGGTVQAFMNLSPAGRLIYSGTGSNVACSGPFLNISSNFLGSSIYSEFGTFWDASIGTTKIVWLLVENNGNTRLARAEEFDSFPNFRLRLSPSCNNLDITSMDQVKLIQDYDSTTLAAQGDTTVSPFVGVKPRQLLSIADFEIAGSPWLNQVLDESNPADLDLILDYYAAILSGQTPASIAPWLLNSYGPELVSIDK